MPLDRVYGQPLDTSLTRKLVDEGDRASLAEGCRLVGKWWRPNRADRAVGLPFDFGG